MPAGERLPLAGMAILGNFSEPFSMTPIIITVVASIIFTAIAYWRFPQKEF